MKLNFCAYMARFYRASHKCPSKFGIYGEPYVDGIMTQPIDSGNTKGNMETVVC